jgi:hypothetical protein
MCLALKGVVLVQDHLGNNRVSYAVDRESNAIKIKEESHYYPFGLKHWNYNNAEYSFQGRNAGVSLMSKPGGGGGALSLPTSL